MNKIEHALHEIVSMDALAARDQWVNRIHPLVKFIVTVVYIFTVVSFPKYDVIGVLSLVVYPLALFLLAELSFFGCLRRLRLILPLVCLVGIANPFFDHQRIVFGGLVVSAGVLSMVTLMGKGVLAVLASYELIATTSVEKICYALRLLHVPRLMVTQFLLTYRYITLLLAEAGRITQAYALRAPHQKGVHLRAWGSLAGLLLLRSMGRAGEVYESMLLRGYRGDYFYPGEGASFQLTDALWLIFWLGVFLLLRFCPLVYILGGMMGGLVS